MVITYVPQVSLWLPAKTGQLKVEEVDHSVEQWNINIFGKSPAAIEATEK
jgi:hypothetical protein